MALSKIRVMHLRCATGSGGGPEKTILNSPLYIDTNKFNVWVTYLRKHTDPDFAVDKKAQELGLKNFFVVDEHRQIDRKALKDLEDLIKTNCIQILHTHGYKSDVWGWLLKKKLPNLRLITTVHGWGAANTWREKAYVQIGKIPLFFFHKILVVNQEIFHSLRKMGIPKDKLVVILNGIDTQYFSRNKRSKQNDERLTLGYIGRLSPEKRIEDLIQAYSSLIKKMQVGYLLIAGEGPLLSELQRIARDYQVENRVRFLGHVEPRWFFNQVDIFVNPSINEGLPNTILESMSMETVVVATPVGGVTELVKDKETGLLIQPKNVDGLEQALRYLIENPNQRRRIIQNARNLICRDFDFSSRMRKIEKIYEEILLSDS